MLLNQPYRRTNLLPGAIIAAIFTLGLWLWHFHGKDAGQSPNEKLNRTANVSAGFLGAEHSDRHASRRSATASGDITNGSAGAPRTGSSAWPSGASRDAADALPGAPRPRGTESATASFPDSPDTLPEDNSARTNPPLTPGQQSYARIPLRADPGMEHLKVGEAEADDDVRGLPTSKLVEEYGKLSTMQEKEEYLAELMASSRSNATRILSDLFKSETDPTVKASILSAAAGAGQSSDFKALLTAALNPEQPVDVRLTALYFAGDNAPELVGQYVNDANLDVREEAQNLVEAQTNNM